MKRFGKHINLIEEMFKRVEFGKDYVKHTRNGVPVYEMQKTQGSLIRLIHYGTTTLIYDQHEREILEYYGESVSDRDSLNTLLACLDHPLNEYFRFGSSIGFILESPKNDDMETENEESEELPNVI